MINNDSTRLQCDPPKTAKELWERLIDFCIPSEEDIAAMSDEEIHQYLKDEGIDIEPAYARLKARLAEIRAEMGEE